jgi:hypothetical protein
VVGYAVGSRAEPGRFSGSLANPMIGDREMHSTLGTVLFSYGVIGFALFLFAAS